MKRILDCQMISGKSLVAEDKYNILFVNYIGMSEADCPLEMRDEIRDSDCASLCQ